MGLLHFLLEENMAHDYLAHYGVLGMKWGVRKSRPTSGERRQKREERKAVRQNKRAVRKNYTGSRDSVARRQYQKKNINEMTNDELREGITRMQLEKQYRDFTKADTMRGHRIVTNVLKYGTLYAAVTKSPYVSAGIAALDLLNDMYDVSKMNRYSGRYPD